MKFANDTYLIVPAANVQSCAAEIAQVDNWAAENNLSLDRSKSVEIVFVTPWSKRAAIIPPPSVSASVHAAYRRRQCLHLCMLNPSKLTVSSAAVSLSLSMLTIC